MWITFSGAYLATLELPRQAKIQCHLWPDLSALGAYIIYRPRTPYSHQQQTQGVTAGMAPIPLKASLGETAQMSTKVAVVSGSAVAFIAVLVFIYLCWRERYVELPPAYLLLILI